MDDGAVPFFSGVSGQVFYRRWAPEGAVGGPRVLLLHGMGQHSGDYNGFARLLTARGIEVWALDHAGHGMTEGELGRPGPLAVLSRNARLLGAIMRADEGAGAGPAPVFAGHSLGAVVAAHAVLQDPDCCGGLVLSGAPFGGGGRGRPDADLPEARARRDAFDAVRRRFTEGAPVATLVLHGADDRIASAERVVAAMTGVPGVEIEVYDDAGHDLPHEPVRDAVAARIAQFVQARIG